MTLGFRRALIGRRAVPALVAIAAALLVAACGGASASPATGAPGSGSAVPLVSPTATGNPPQSSDQPASSASPSGSGPGASFDPSLLAVLPPELDGLALTPIPEAAAEADPTGIDGIAFAIAADPASGSQVVVDVTRFASPPADADYRYWRDTFDRGVCERAGGVAGHATATIGGHETFIATCAGGVRTYHVRLRDRRVIVSLQDVGDRRLGEHLVAALKD